MKILKSRWVKYSIAFLLIGLFVWLADLSQVASAVAELTWGTAAALILVSVLLIYVSALKWKIFIEAYGREASLSRLYLLYLVGYFVNLLMPSYVGGDAVRSWYVGKKIGQHEAAAATILERFTGLIAMVFLALLFMWWLPAVTIELKATILVIALGLVVVSWLALTPRAIELFGKFPLFSKFRVHLLKVQSGLQLAAKNPKLLLNAMVLSLLFHSITVVNVLVAGAAVGWVDAPFWELFVVLPLILLIGIIPITPSGLGIQEGAYYFFLPLLGATPAQAIGVALVLRAKAYLLAGVGGVAWLAIRSEREGGLEKSAGELSRA